MNLDKLFQQIIQHEQTAENRRERIIQVKRQIAQSDAEVSSLKESVASSRGRLRLLVRQFHDEKAECQVLQEQKNVLQNRTNEVDEEIENLESQISQKKKALDDMRSSHFKNIMEFCEGYDLTGEGAEKRIKGRKEKIVSLEERKKKLEERIKNAQAQEEKSTELMEQKACLQAEISQLQSTIIAVDSEIEQKHKQLADAPKQVEQYKAECHSDPELIQLQRELNSVKCPELEARVRNLRAELSRVKSRQWKRQQQIGGNT